MHALVLAVNITSRCCISIPTTKRNTKICYLCNERLSALPLDSTGGTAPDLQLPPNVCYSPPNLWHPDKSLVLVCQSPLPYCDQMFFRQHINKKNLLRKPM